jgi:hypothetical protein
MNVKMGRFRQKKSWTIKDVMEKDLPALSLKKLIELMVGGKAVKMEKL